MRLGRGEKLLIATHNAGKLDEIATLLEPFGVTAVSAASLGLPEPAETETTFVGNARIKAHAAAHASGMLSLADDSGIAVEALDGAPGVHTADWAETPNGRDFAMAMKKTWALLEKLGAPYPWRAQFHSALVLAQPDGRDIVFEGVVHGQVVWPMRGRLGHGYDPMFQPDGCEMTFAEMDQHAKNLISHRADAFTKFVKECLA